RQGQLLNELEIAQFTTAVLVWLGKQYAKRGWVMQLHIGALRNNNTRMFNLLGADSGFDSIGDNPIAYPLSRLLDEMDMTDELPKTILY
ncbi:glucuronate isomerase, partial [Xenorhabdus bovienii]